MRVSLQVDAQGQALEQPLELSFQDQYGDIERHLWFGDGYILLGFSTGTSTLTPHSSHKEPDVACCAAHPLLAKNGTDACRKDISTHWPRVSLTC